MIKRILVILTLIGSITFMTSNVFAASEEGERPDIYKGRIIEVTSDEMVEYTTSGGGYKQRVQEADVLLTNGPYKGEIVSVINYIDEVYAYNLDLRKDTSIYVMMNYDEWGNLIQSYVYEYQRDKYLYALIFAFLLMMVLVGGIKGFKSLITLGLTIVGVYFMLDGVIKGGNAILLSMMVSILVTIVTMALIAGFNSKAVSAIIGTMAGVLVAGIIALIVSRYAHLTGLGSSEAQMLLFSDHATNFNFSNILFASILIGTLGAVMDVAMSIASSINEITEANPLLSTMDLFRSGMNIGRDVMGTMANTLILAYAGTSMFLLLVFFVNDVPYIDIMNMDMIATEIVRAVAGTMGLIMSIPITALVSSILEKKRVAP